MEDDGERAPLAVARSRRQAEEWVLVLQSQGVAADARRTREGWHVETPSADAERARRVLAAWHEENRRAPEPAPEPRAPFPWLAMAALSAALLGFFALTGPRDAGSDWFAAGSARAALILRGEWWRVVTALTLHADAGHVLGNVVAATLFVGAVCQRFGTGCGLALLTAAGGLGNLANAVLHATRHSSVGASTAIFAAVGALAADAWVRRRAPRGGRPGAGREGRPSAPRGGRLAPLAAGLGILAMLGTGAQADLWAHFFGLLAGLALGRAAAPRLPRPPAAPWQAVAGALTAAAVGGAWLLAR
jgi:membrane associated rhomboid family serine protease